MKFNKMTIICPTYDNLEYLNLFYDSYIKAKEKYIRPNDINIIIGINGNDKKSELFCINNNINYTTQEKLGMYSGTNIATKCVTDGYLIIINDDIYLDDMFFNRLHPHLKTKSVLISNSIQPDPSGGTFTPWYNWGETYENFNIDGFLKYCRRIEKDESSFHNFGVVYAIDSFNWSIVNGFDERFDPWGGGMADLMYRLFLSGIRNFLVLHNVLHYHFIRKCAEKHDRFNDITKNGELTSLKFNSKWKKGFEEIDNIIKKECSNNYHDNNITMRSEKFKLFLEKNDECKSNHSIESIKFITELIPPDKYPKMLDIGCGEGRETAVLQALGYDVTGITLGDDNLKHSKENYPLCNIILMDMHDLKFKSNSFDAIYIHHAFEHSIAPFIQLMEMYCVLKDNGLMWVGLPHYKEPKDNGFDVKIHAINYHHKNMLSPILFKTLFNTGFYVKQDLSGKFTSNVNSIYFDHSYLLEKKPFEELDSEVQSLVKERIKMFG